MELNGISLIIVCPEEILLIEASKMILNTSNILKIRCVQSLAIQLLKIFESLEILIVDDFIYSCSYILVCRFNL